MSIWGRRIADTPFWKYMSASGFARLQHQYRENVLDKNTMKSLWHIVGGVAFIGYLSKRGVWETKRSQSNISRLIRK